MMPPIPAIVAVPNDRHDGYFIANVVAAIPLAGGLYAVTAIDPTSSPHAPRFFAAYAGQSIHGTWTADSPDLDSTDSLADAVHTMLAIRASAAWPGSRRTS